MEKKSNIISVEAAVQAVKAGRLIR